MSQIGPAGGAHGFAMGSTTVTMASDGSVTEVRHPRRDHSMLLDEGAPGPEGSMHDAAHRWGKGFAILDGRGYRFDAPSRQEWRGDGCRSDISTTAARGRVPAGLAAGLV
jgi:hypothetical protein